MASIYQYCVVIVTTATEADATLLAQQLVQARLAACVQIYPIQSMYRWQGEVHQDREWQLLIKTRYALFPQVRDRLQEWHSYEVPEIIALPIIAGSSAYLGWLEAETQVPPTE
ncbi:divalent-cation tolerance protein CutA [Synechococcus sp. PCC 6717]|jgi:periplasmic divalent cation tolerance protein|uniref:Divalent-cation tolerance protein CutA n=1 Tax=Parathermosynechococcus lividus PCC 6715 TaxID=1917166 RepID=A0A2D2Q468_PARLV|nr:divalent-cation tolerance protein CutA [Thermostichus lividus]ATS19324.1 divalent-cation tolerance protein CutA [Thermostichus lividus PCC 6715]MCH9056766.1 divalent-cation tolerance protein CutA [Synechococcus sp. PCC 6716]MCI3281032.1 divalent-cation tolerance protein CutA [Synechococcus sp. PCC 6717]